MQHAFRQPPAQLAHVQHRVANVTCEGVFGVAEAWDVPCARWHAPRGFDIAYPANDHVTLSVLVEGQEFVRMDGRWRGRAGGGAPDAFLLYPGGYDRRWLARGAVTYHHLYLKPSLIAASAEDLLDGRRVELRDDRMFAADRELRPMLDQYVRRAMDPLLPPSRLEMDTRAALLAYRLVECHSDIARRPPPRRGGLAPARLRAVVDHVEAHLDERLDLATLAALAGLGRHHFATAFRAATGLAPHRFVVQRRIERAKALLRGPMPLAEVALAVGFCSQQHFCTAFRQATGTSPGVWRAAQLP